MIPQIENSNSLTGLNIVTYPNKTYKYSDYQIVSKVDGLEAIKQAIKHILSVERYAYLIYDNNYGVELAKYIGQDYSYLEATIEDTLREALTQDDRILDVKVTDILYYKKQETMTDKTKLYKNISTEPQPEIDLITTENKTNIITDRTNILTMDNDKVDLKVAEVKFDVYCKQGIINTEVQINV